MYLIGSRAINLNSDSSDWDIVLDGENILPRKGVDIAPEGLNCLEVCRQYSLPYEVETPVGMATPISEVGVMLMKRSHLHRPIKFAKHIREYHTLKERNKGAIDEIYLALLQERTKLTKQKYGDKTPSLRKNKSEFFDDYVAKVYEHDDIHYATCYGDKPIYERLKLNKETVFCERDLWNQLSFTDQVNCVREEAFVIAIERYLMWKKGYPPKYAFFSAVERISTTLTSGWFRDFAIENWSTIVDCDYNFVEKFKNAGFRFSCDS